MCRERALLQSLARVEFGQIPGFSERVDPELPFHQPHFSHNILLELAELSLPLFQDAHDLETFDRGIGGFQRFEAAHWPDQLLQLTVIGLDHVVQMSVRHCIRDLAVLFEFRDRYPIGRSLVRIDRLGLLPILQSAHCLAQETFGDLGVPGW